MHLMCLGDDKNNYIKHGLSQPLSIFYSQHSRIVYTVWGRNKTTDFANDILQWAFMKDSWCILILIAHNRVMNCGVFTGINLRMHPANEGRRNSVTTPYLIGWEHTHNDPVFIANTIVTTSKHKGEVFNHNAFVFSSTFALFGIPLSFPDGWRPCKIINKTKPRGYLCAVLYTLCI